MRQPINKRHAQDTSHIPETFRPELGKRYLTYRVTYPMFDKVVSEEVRARSSKEAETIIKQTLWKKYKHVPVYVKVFNGSETEYELTYGEQPK